MQTVAEQAGSLRASVCQLRRKLGGVTLLRTVVELWLLAAAAGGDCVQLGRVAREHWGSELLNFWWWDRRWAESHPP